MRKKDRTNMNKFIYTLMAVLAAGCMLQSCSDEETYAEQKERERDIIASFLRRDVKIKGPEGETIIDVGRIRVISENQFEQQGCVTDVEKNEYVLFGNNGVYMQIVREGTGDKLASGETKRLICRYVEFNMMGDSVQTTNNVPYWLTGPDYMNVTNTSGTFKGTFNTSGAMYTYYNTTAVPSAWLIPLTYVKIGRQTTAEEGIAKVRLIVPHSQGQTDATRKVYPCFYELTYEETRF